jgi:zinc and cadmium transporter
MSPPPHSEIAYTILALSAVTAASLIGSVTFALGKRFERALPYLISAAAGALLATASTHLMLEAVERLGAGRRMGLLLLIGFFLSFLLERLLALAFRDNYYENPVLEVEGATSHSHSAHEHSHFSDKPLVANILLGGFAHSLIDGLAIATGFAVGHSVGLATTVAALLHEVPHHMADVALLVYSGMSKPRAVYFNFLATTGCAFGGAILLVSRSNSEFLASILLPITAANFFYIALSMLIPELQRERDSRRSVLQLTCFTGAAACLAALSFFARD